MHPADVTWPVEVIGSATDLLAAVQRLITTSGSCDSSVAWKGMARLEWTLRSTLDRALLPASATEEYRALLARERAILEQFRVRAQAFASQTERQFLRTIEGEGVWDVMALGRHSGLPTRIVDWSASPLVAAYFACMEHADSDGVVWWFDQAPLEAILHFAWDSWGVPTRAQACGLGGIDPTLQAALGLNQRCLSAVAFDAHCIPWITKLHHPFVFPRMEAQQGFMTMCGRVRTDHNDAIDSLPGADSLRRGRLVIDKRAKSGVLRWLRQCNLSAQSLLYPGIDIAARAIAHEIEHSPPRP